MTQYHSNRIVSTLATLAVASVLIAAQSASAAAITGGTQIGIAPGPTLTDDVGNDWNDLATTNTTYNTIHDLNGDTLTGVSVQFAGGGINTAGEDNWVGLSTNGATAPAEFVDSVTTDLWFNNGTVTITGLNTALTYNIYSVNHGGGPGFDAAQDTHTITGDVVYGPSTVSRGTPACSARSTRSSASARTTPARSCSR